MDFKSLVEKAPIVRLDSRVNDMLFNNPLTVQQKYIATYLEKRPYFLRELSKNKNPQDFYTEEQGDMLFWIGCGIMDQAIPLLQYVARQALEKMGRRKCEVTGSYYFLLPKEPCLACAHRAAIDAEEAADMEDM